VDRLDAAWESGGSAGATVEGIAGWFKFQDAGQKAEFLRQLAERNPWMVKEGQWDRGAFREGRRIILPGGELELSDTGLGKMAEYVLDSQPAWRQILGGVGRTVGERALWDFMWLSLTTAVDPIGWVDDAMTVGGDIQDLANGFTWQKAAWTLADATLAIAPLVSARTGRALRETAAQAGDARRLGDLASEVGPAEKEAAQELFDELQSTTSKSDIHDGGLNHLKAGQKFEEKQLNELGLLKNTEIWRPSQDDINSAAFRTIVGTEKYTQGGQLVGTIIDSAEGRFLEIKGGSSSLESSYQLRLQVYRSLKEGIPLTIRTTRPINPTFRNWLIHWGINIEDLSK